MPISSRVDESKRLTTFTGIGQISFEDVRNAIDSFYSGQPTLQVIWDLQNANTGGISSDEVDRIANLILKHGGIRERIKTALVAPSDVSYGLSRMLISVMEAKESLPARMGVFRTMEEAVRWLAEVSNSASPS